MSESIKNSFPVQEEIGTQYLILLNELRLGSNEALVNSIAYKRIAITLGLTNEQLDAQYEPNSSGLRQNIWESRIRAARDHLKGKGLVEQTGKGWLITEIGIKRIEELNR